MNCNRIHMIVLDSVGIGEAADAAAFNDTGAHTLGHIAEGMELKLPNLEKMGLGNIADIKGIKKVETSQAYWTKLAEKSVGKDTMTGHWEIAGLQVDTPFRVFQKVFQQNCWIKFQLILAERSLETNPLQEQVF